jgi:hypothetical protein
VKARAPGDRDSGPIAVVEADRPGEGWGMFYARGENFRHIRHERILARWPVLSESWALQLEEARIAAVDHTPGAATFGR